MKFSQSQNKTHNRCIPCKHLFRLCLLAMLMAVMAAPAAGDSAGGPKRGPTHEGQGTSRFAKAQEIVLESDKFGLTTQSGRHYRVNRETLILGVDGKETTLNKIPVPCDVTVTHYISKGTRIARRIDVDRVTRDATRR
ncbi:MAG: hypothetical protein KFF50_01555 [Desulfatitalea sp.]|nr:hypothetical protein [Desulfatitalea sp.]